MTDQIASESTTLTSSAASAADAGALILLRVYGTLLARGLRNEVNRTDVLAAAAEVTRGIIESMEPGTVFDLSQG